MTVIVNGTAGITYPNSTTQAGAAVILQVVQAVKTDTFATTPGAVWANVSGLSVSITPISSSNKILIIVDMKAAGTTSVSEVRSRLLRDSTAIYIGDAASNRPRGLSQMYVGDQASGSYYLGQIGGTFLDSPATTSAITYKMQIGGDSDATTVYVNRTQSDRDTTYYDTRGVSSITVMEVAA